MATVVFAGSVGTIIEWYDFFIYGRRFHQRAGLRCVQERGAFLWRES
jgi:hypothetical protein